MGDDREAVLACAQALLGATGDRLRADAGGASMTVHAVTVAHGRLMVVAEPGAAGAGVRGHVHAWSPDGPRGRLDIHLSGSWLPLSTVEIPCFAVDDATAWAWDAWPCPVLALRTLIVAELDVSHAEVTHTYGAHGVTPGAQRSVHVDRHDVATALLR